ncbi:hypothetical protein [Campylobacter sp. MIT 97-5078]|uniref:hypothetical protein n=1 Tax=Campylobacter sp. MIT 97-5078 TaxID=1548153 RepID=UPI00068DE9EB|nr:hypothetical protein [Campylobacter sp. MIT 97-5078]
MYSLKIREEELKLKVAGDFFAQFDTTRIVQNIDFCVVQKDRLDFDELGSNTLLWAEAKKGELKLEDFYQSFVQLILTIGKAKINEKTLPPEYLGAFDAVKIAFIPYESIAFVFNQNDFNWQVTPSNHESKEFKQLYAQIKELLKDKSLIFDFFIQEKDEVKKNKDLEHFLHNDFIVGWGQGKAIAITKNNFNIVYQKWLAKVKPSIKLDYKDEDGKVKELNPADFYLADLLSKDNKSLKQNLEVVLLKDHYEKTLPNGFELSFKFKDEQKAHKDFWSFYERPPAEEVRKHILKRRDLLVPRDIRERKGAFFTPAIWVEKAQEYLAKALGENYQDEYIIWDLCAGTGNLLANLQNKKQIYASTLDEADVKIMKDDAKEGKNNLFEKHIFQFDFLNDELLDEVDKKGNILKKSKVPEALQAIIKEEQKRKKLLIFINPPYAEATSSKSIVSEKSEHKDLVAESTIKNKYQHILRQGAKELYVQFLARIYEELPNCILANFYPCKFFNFEKFARIQFGSSS